MSEKITMIYHFFFSIFVFGAWHHLLNTSTLNYCKIYTFYLYKGKLGNIRVNFTLVPQYLEHRRTYKILGCYNKNVSFTYGKEISFHFVCNINYKNVVLMSSMIRLYFVSLFDFC